MWFRPQRVGHLIGLGLLPWFLAQPALGSEPKLSPVRLQGQTKAQSLLELQLDPILGQRSTPSRGWNGYLARVHNPTSMTLVGRLSLHRSVPGLVRGSSPLIETEVSVPAGGTVRLEIPVAGPGTRSVEAKIVSSSGLLLGRTEAFAGYDSGPLLFDLDELGGIGQKLRQLPLPGSTASATGPNVSAARATLDQETGEPLLPEFSASYSGATLVLSGIEKLDSLRDAQQRALVGWVLAGGSLAITVHNPSHLRSPLLHRLVGAAVKPGPIAELLASPDARRSAVGSEFEKLTAVTSDMAPELMSALQGFVGGNLAASPWGSAASYGMGEVHLLGFTPNRGLFRGSEFAKARMLTLMAHAWKRRAQVALPLAQQDPADSRHQTVARELDPNAENHWAIISATLALLLYALLAGPVSFQRAAKAGKPLRALIHLPIWSMSALVFILLLGIWSRGTNEKSRHLTLLEAGAGMGVASSVSFRAFNASSFEDLRIRAAARDHVLGLATGTGNVSARLSLDNTGLQLESIFTKPWKTVVVREDGFDALGGGVSLIATDGDLLIRNEIGRALVGVIVRTTDGRLYGFDAIDDGEQVSATSGRQIRVHGAPIRSVGYPLLAHEFRDHLERGSPGLSEAWQALEAVAGYEVDWWPEDVPAALAQVAGGLGRLSDSGIPLEQDRVLLRVIGYGESR